MKLTCLFPAALGAALLAGAPSEAQQWSDQFDLSGVSGRIFSLSSYQGDLIAGGYDGLQTDNQNLGLVARWDGAHWQALGSGIAGAGAFEDRDVRDFATYGGDLVAGGTFTFAGGQATRSIARFDGVDWQPLGAGLDLSFAVTGSVFSLAVYQGDLYASGQFDLAGGAPVSGLARWDGSQWHDVGGGFDTQGGGAPGFAWKMLVGNDGLLYLAGEFTAAGGVAGTTNVATWNGTSFGSVGGGFPPSSASVRDLAWYQGELWAVGIADLVPGGGLDEKAAIFDGSSWRAAGNFPDSAVSTRIDAIEVLGTDVYVGGNIVGVDGVPLRRMARFDGTSWSSPGGIFAQSINQFVFDLFTLDQQLYVGGEFSSVGYLPPQNEAFASESIGVFDGTSWDGVGQGLGVNAQVNESLAWNGGVVAFGPFTQAGATLTGQPAFFDGASWSSLGSFGLGIARGGTVHQGDLVVVGSFGSVDGQPAPAPAARFDGQSWQPLGSGDLANAVDAAVFQGELYALADYGLWRLEGSVWNHVGTQIFGQPYDLHAHGSGLYVGGDYFGQGHVLEWDGQNLSPLGGGVDDAVRALGSYGADLVVGGEFSIAGGSPANLLARWNGSSFQAVGSLTGTDVTALAELGGDLYVGGNLFVPGSPPEKYVARFDGATFHALGSGMNGQPLTMTADEATGRLYVGGIFLSAGGNVARNFTIWDTGLGGGFAYCTAKTSSSGCVGAMSASGLPSSTSPASYVVGASELEALKNGLIFYGLSQAALPFQGGTLCVQPPLRRTPVASSGGAAACTGSLSIDFNAWIQSGVDATLQPGVGVATQAWLRDPADPSGFGVALTDGFTFTIQP